MLKIRYITIILILAALMSSCEKVVDFNPGEVEPYVVMVSKPVGDSLVAVYLGYSRFFLDNREFNLIDNATVTITSGNNTAVGTYDPQCFILGEYDDGDYYYYYDTTYYGGYRFVLRPNPGDTMRINATVPGRDEAVSAMTVVPRQPQIEIVDFVVDTLDEGYSQEFYYRLRFKINCNSNKEYFSVRLLQAQTNLVDSVLVWDTTQMASQYFSVNDPIVNNASLEDAFDGDDGSFYGRVMNFSSERFTGGSHEFTMEFSMTRYATYDWYYVQPDPLTRSFIIDIRALSEELYRYNVTSTGYTSDLDDLFAEPVQVYCNIKGGIGIFGASTIKKVKMPTPRVENFHNSSSYYYKKKK